MNVSDDKNIEIKAWYDAKKNLFEMCAKEMCSLLEKLLLGNKIQFHSITYRVKEKESLIKKIEKKNYDNPFKQIMDVSGIRIITYTLQEVVKICNMIESEFKIDTENSTNKANELDVDRVGYLSVHYVVNLNEARSILSEYKNIKDFKSEIQVRTLLQHAWAEIEHDRNYKFYGKLPKEIERRFYLVSGVLEMMDSEFDLLSKEIDEYAGDIRIKTENGELNIDINSISLVEYLKNRFKNINYDNTISIEDDFISELKDFGINTISDIDKIIPHNFEELEMRYYKSNTYVGILRDLMIINDYNKYFKNAYKKRWEGVRKMDVTFFSNFDIDFVEAAKKYNFK